MTSSLGGGILVIMGAKVEKNRTVSATEFKAKCLALLDEVAETGGTITVTKRGRPVAEVRASHRARTKKRKPLMGSWEGRAKIVGDIINLDNCEFWQWSCLDPSDPLNSLGDEKE